MFITSNSITALEEQLSDLKHNTFLKELELGRTPLGEEVFQLRCQIREMETKLSKLKEEAKEERILNILNKVYPQGVHVQSQGYDFDYNHYTYPVYVVVINGCPTIEYIANGLYAVDEDNEERHCRLEQGVHYLAVKDECTRLQVLEEALSYYINNS